MAVADFEKAKGSRKVDEKELERKMLKNESLTKKIDDENKNFEELNNNLTIIIQKIAENTIEITKQRIIWHNLMKKDLREYYDSLLKMPTIRALLLTIEHFEGGLYNNINGGDTVDDLSTHPGILDHNNEAAGRYQIQTLGWITYTNALGLSDFHPHTQDILAIMAISNRGGFDAALDGDIEALLPKIVAEWSSLPYGPRHRPKGKTQDDGAYPARPQGKYSDVKAYYEKLLALFKENPEASVP